MERFATTILLLSELTRWQQIIVLALKKLPFFITKTVKFR